MGPALVLHLLSFNKRKKKSTCYVLKKRKEKRKKKRMEMKGEERKGIERKEKKEKKRKEKKKKERKKVGLYGKKQGNKRKEKKKRKDKKRKTCCASPAVHILNLPRPTSPGLVMN